MNRDLDLLFVIDDSVAFLDTQIGFATAFPAFLQELTSLDGGLPNVHIGIVTSDLGTLGAADTEPGPSIGSGPGSCSGFGKAGNLQINGAAVSDPFISDIQLSDGTRVTNYSGTLADVFRQMASVGSTGCGFEQHLQAAKRALDSNPANAGFLRPTAGLAVFVLADEDDCSFTHSTFLGPADTTLGPLASFRCARFGVSCDEGGIDSDEMNQPGVKTGCHSNENSPYVVHLADYVMFFKGLKSDPRDVMVGVISGDSTPYDVGLVSPPGGGTPIPALKNICTGLDAIAPSVRLPEIAAMFSRGVAETVCTTDLAPAQASLARRVRNLAGDSCVPRAPPTDADCVVVDQRADGSETLLPHCPATTDCYDFVEDAACTGSQVRLAVQRSSVPPADTMSSVRCAL